MYVQSLPQGTRPRPRDSWEQPDGVFTVHSRQFTVGKRKAEGLRCRHESVQVKALENRHSLPGWDRGLLCSSDHPLSSLARILRRNDRRRSVSSGRYSNDGGLSRRRSRILHDHPGANCGFRTRHRDQRCEVGDTARKGHDRVQYATTRRCHLPGCRRIHHRVVRRSSPFSVLRSPTEIALRRGCVDRDRRSLGSR